MSHRAALIASIALTLVVALAIVTGQRTLFGASEPDAATLLDTPIPSTVAPIDTGQRQVDLSLPANDPNVLENAVVDDEDEADEHGQSARTGDVDAEHDDRDEEHDEEDDDD